jgi:hypothetical protein
MAIADSLNNRIILINYKENKIIKIILQNKLKGFLFLDVHYIEFVNSKTILFVLQFSQLNSSIKWKQNKLI